VELRTSHTRDVRRRAFGRALDRLAPRPPLQRQAEPRFRYPARLLSPDGPSVRLALAPAEAA
jgi:hypothetical protein